MVEGRNLLEVVLNTDIAKKFNAVDTAVDGLQKSMERAATSANKFATALSEINKSIEGSNIGNIADNLQKLSSSLNQLENSSGSDNLKRIGGDIQGINTSSQATIDSINNLTNALNKLIELRSASKKEPDNDYYEKAYLQHLKQMRDLELQRFKDRESERQKETENERKELEERKKAWESYFKDLEKREKEKAKLIQLEQEAMRRSVSGSLAYSKSTKTNSLEQERKAIKYLIAAREQLSTSDKNYEKILKMLNDEILRHKKNIEKAEGSTRRFREENLKLRNILQQVAGAFGVYLGFQSILNFAREVATVTGEFEIQHRAMQAIIGDMDAANKLWDKTVRLAVKSPYSVKDLVTYTKQLAAYRVETEKLYDTTKMLADISSGLGVDMGRLILAYGQVKAANYLRGQELRQFSEAGVNILGELAKYFSELRGEMVSTGEVFDMVSKRMVKFEDVSEVLKRLTKEGGIFYNMQEIQAETLKGMFMNLKDSFDLMKNEIGESHKDFFVGLVNAAKYLADNWKTVGNVLRAVIGIMAIFKIAQISAATHMIKTGAAADIEALGLGRISKALVGVMTGMRGAKTATIGFSTALKNIPVIGWILAAISAIITVVSIWNQKLKENNELQNELNKIQIESNVEVNKMINQYESLVSKIKDTNTTESERNELLSKMKRLYGDILPQRMLEIEYITKEGNAYQDAIQALRDYYQEKRRQRQLETVEAEYGERMSTAQTSLARAIQSEIKDMHGVEVPLASITAALEEYRKGWEDGTVTIENCNNQLREFIKIQTGIRPALTTTQSLIAGWQAMFGADMESRISTYNSSIRDYITNTNEAVNTTYTFGDSLRESFDEGLKKANEDFESEALKIKNNPLLNLEEIQTQLKQKASDIYGEFWKNFTESSYDYGEHKGFFDNLFNVEIEPRINENQFTNAQKTIAKKVDSLTSQLNIKHKDGLDKLLYDGKTSWKEYYDNIKKKSEEMSKDLRMAEAGLLTLTDDELVKLKEQEPLLAKFAEWLKEIFDPKKTTGSHGNPALQLLNKQIDAIKNAASQYKEYKEMYDDVSAFNKTKDAVSDMFKEVGLNKLLGKGFDENVFDEKNIREQMKNWLSAQIAAAGKAGNIAAEKYLRTLQLELDKADYKEMMKTFQKEMGDAFDELDLGRELDKLGIGKDFANILFGIDTRSTDDLRKMVEEWKEGLQAKGMFGTGEKDEYNKQMEKINDIEDKQQKERMKKYINYMQQAMSERVKIETMGMREIMEIEETFDKEIAKAKRDNDMSRANELEGLKQIAIQGSKEETEKSMQKQIWKDFKSSDMYTDLFNDIDTTSTKVIDAVMKKLASLKGSLNQLDPSDLKSIVQEMNKLESELIDRNPFQKMMEYYKEVQKMKGAGITEESLSVEYTNKSEEIEQMQQEIDLMQESLYIRQQMTEEQIASEGYTLESFRAENESIRANLNLKKQQVTAKQNEVIGIKQQLQSFKNLRTAAQTYANQWKSMTGSIKSAVESVMDNIDAFGAETNNTTEAWGDLLGSILDIMGVIPLYVAGMTAAGIAVNSAMGIIGLIAEAIQLVITLVSALAKMDDAAAQDQIDGIQKKIDHLSDAYDRLKEKFDEAWDVSRLREYRKELEENIKRQISDYNAMIAVEKTRKTPDKDQMYEWEQAKLDLQEDMKELSDDFKKEMGGIGASEYKDAAQEFVDAWADAFLETGDGLEGLKEHFEEVLQNLVKKQAMQRIASNYLNNLFGMIDSAIGDEGIVTPEEINDIREEFDRIAPLMNQAFQAIFNSLGLFGDQAESELSGLQKGIQGVTEETAEILAAYLNSIRYYIIDTNTKLGELVAVMQDTTGAFNPMLNELRNIKQRADDIYNFLFTRRENGTDSLRVYIVN